MFDKIIGYEKEKLELIKFCDAIVNSQYYKSLGINIPKGIMLYGEPGVGKTTFANSVIEYCNVPYYILRKNADTATFINNMNEIFEKAKESAPSIVILDDMDKYGNGDRFSQEYTALQGAIDNYKQYDIFIIATVNDVYVLPPSLTRSGRFDMGIKIDNPRGQESSLISNHYIDTKNLNISPDVDRNIIGRLLEGCSCATIEVVINTAARYAAFERHNFITMNNFVEAILAVAYNRPPIQDSRTIQKKYEDAIYNTGKGLVEFILEPNEFKFITIRPKNYSIISDSKNVAKDYMKYYSANKNITESFKDVTVLLSGKLAYEMKLGIPLSGSYDTYYNDMDDIGGIISSVVTETKSLIGVDIPSGLNEDGVAKELGIDTSLTPESFVKNATDVARNILVTNWSLVEAIANTLVTTQDTLLITDIERIKNSIYIGNYGYGNFSGLLTQ